MKNFIPIAIATVVVAVPQTTAFAQSGAPDDAKLSKGPKGFTVVDTAKYTLQIPNGWVVGKETPWGARDILAKSESGKFGAMTAGPTQAGWDQLNKTSLAFIKREEPGEETPFRTGKTKAGYESMSFEVKNKSGFFSRRYTLVRNAAGSVLALSIKIPSVDQEKRYIEMFNHMVETAKLK
ncbi:MAG TPA: hypothetical protein VK171_09565 [Fimbriimonas sp.]|nr:hypothetical protein [Fimbriimonas sp.]